jgi:D-alanyl-D-alanine carboxypeptidase/D-alanyl-D-alanine-endopeptidase (penicillin-binding protein 4)
MAGRRMTEGGRAGRREQAGPGGSRPEWTGASHRRARIVALTVLFSAPLLAQAPPPASSRPLPPPPAASLTRRLDKRLDAPPLSRFLWGVAAMDDRGHLLYGRNAERLFVPASTAKLVVSAVAAALLPPDGTVRTSVYATGPLVNGVLRGDLVLYGRGDPTMSRRCYATDTTRAFACEADPSARFRRLAAALRAEGIHAVAGDLVGDGSWFEPTMTHPDWEGYDLNWWYAAPVSGLGFNDNSVDITWGAGPAPGRPGQVSFSPVLGDVTLDNHTTTVPGDTGATIDFFRDPGTLRIRAEGLVPYTASGRTEHFALPDPNLFAAWAFGAALSEAGIAIQGRTRSTTDSTAYRTARAAPPLAEAESRPFRDWIFPILNTSQNWFAEVLLKQLGRRFGRAGSWAEGLATERRFLIDSVRLDSTQFALVDGSGLAASNAVSPSALVRLLQFARRRPHMEAFLDALPRSGTRGSLRSRFLGTPVEGRVLAKPGSIRRVNGLAGYLDLADGRRVTFAVLVNHHTLPGTATIAAIDSVVVDIARGLGNRP